MYTPTETSPRASAVVIEVAAKVATVVVLPELHAVEVDGVALVKVRADSNMDLLILTLEPLSPVALVKMLTVTSWEVVPPNIAVLPAPNKLTPLKVV